MSTDTYDAARARIAELRALVEAGTPGPWVHYYAGQCCAGECLTTDDGHGMHNGSLTSMTLPDLRKFVAAVNLLPAVLDMAEVVLERHYPLTGKSTYTRGYEGVCCHGEDYERTPLGWPCPDAASVLRFLGIEDGA